MPDFREPPKYGIDTDVMNYLMGQHKPRLPEDEDDYLGKIEQATTPGVMGVMADSAAKMGTIGGVQADASPVMDFAKGLEKNQMGRDQKLAQYLGGIQKSQTERDMDLYDQEGRRKHEKDMARIKGSYKKKPETYEDRMSAKRRMKTEDEYYEWSEVGKEQSAKSINQLQAGLKRLNEESKKFIQAGGGSISGSLPDYFRTEESIKLRDQITSVAMLTLKDIFTGSISNEERTELAKTYYNDMLGAKDNIPILKRQLAKLERIHNNKQRRMMHFQTHKNLDTYQGISLKDDLKSIRERDPVFTKETKQETPAGKVKLWNPRKGKYIDVSSDRVEWALKPLSKGGGGATREK